MHTSSTTNTHGHTSPWGKTRQNPGPFNLPQWVRWWSYRKWAGCIIAMSEELPEALIVPDHYPHLELNSMMWRASVALLLSPAVWSY